MWEGYNNASVSYHTRRKDKSNNIDGNVLAAQSEGQRRGYF